jgi:hypothetical protein
LLGSKPTSGNFALGFSANSAKVRAWAWNPRVTALKWNGAVVCELRPSFVAGQAVAQAGTARQLAKVLKWLHPTLDEPLAPPNFKLELEPADPLFAHQSFRACRGASNRATPRKLFVRTPPRRKPTPLSPLLITVIHSVRCARPRTFFLYRASRNLPTSRNPNRLRPEFDKVSVRHDCNLLGDTRELLQPIARGFKGGYRRHSVFQSLHLSFLPQFNPNHIPI